MILKENYFSQFEIIVIFISHGKACIYSYYNKAYLLPTAWLLNYENLLNYLVSRDLKFVNNDFNGFKFLRNWE